MADDEKDNVIDMSAEFTKTRVLHQAQKEQGALDEGVRELAVARGVCPCQTIAENPGPHLPECPYSDPDYEADPFGIAHEGWGQF